MPRRLVWKEEFPWLWIITTRWWSRLNIKSISALNFFSAHFQKVYESLSVNFCSSQPKLNIIESRMNHRKQKTDSSILWVGFLWPFLALNWWHYQSVTLYCTVHTNVKTRAVRAHKASRPFTVDAAAAALGYTSTPALKASLPTLFKIYGKKKDNLLSFLVNGIMLLLALNVPFHGHFYWSYFHCWGLLE